MIQFQNHPDWSFAEKTFVKQSMMLCAFEILLKNGRQTGGNRSSMNLSSVVGHAWAVRHELSSATGHAWVVTRERPCRYKSTNLVFILIHLFVVESWFCNLHSFQYLQLQLHSFTFYHCPRIYSKIYPVAALSVV